MELVQRSGALFGDEVRAAPGISGFVDRDLVAGAQEFRGDAAQEVGVAVVPIRNERMVEKDNLHAATSSRCRQCA